MNPSLKLFFYSPISTNNNCHLKFIVKVLWKERCYVRNIFTTNHKWLVVIGSNLNLTLRKIMWKKQTKIKLQLQWEDKYCVEYIFPFYNQNGEYVWQWSGAGPKNRVFVPALYGFVLPHSLPNPHDGENFLIPSPPLRVPRNPAPPRKTLLFVNLPYN